MRRKGIRLLICMMIVLFLPFSIAAVVLYPRSPYGETFLAGLSCKMERLEQTEKPRIIVIGGSGVSFALRSDLLEQEYPEYQVVNFGLYAGLGTTVMLDLVKQNIREGDILLFAPELNEQTLSTYFDGKSMLQAADGHPSWLLSLNQEEKESVIGAMPSFAGEKLRFLWERSGPEGDGVYSASSYNEYGDIVYAERTSNIMPEGYDQNMPVTFETDLLSEEFIDTVNAFDRYCKKRGASFYWYYAPVNAAAVDREAESREQTFDQKLRSFLSCEVLGSLSSSILDEEWFYDTNFHLNDAGAIYYTGTLALDLRKITGKEEGSALSFSLPEKPGREETGDTLEASVYQNNTEIRNIIIPETTVSIQDGSFSGCTSLQRIILVSAVPSACTVGTGLLEGTDALIYVPKEAYSSYCTDYFWSAYAQRIRNYTPEVEELLADQASDTGETTVQEETGEAETGEAVSETNEAYAAVIKAENEDSIAGELLRHQAMTITYEGNGGTLVYNDDTSLTVNADGVHIRPNTLAGTRYFKREGYLLIGWNTKADGSGTMIGLGSRVEREKSLTLYAIWQKATDVKAFSYEIVNSEVYITGYSGEGRTCAIPDTIEGLPVTRISSGAFCEKKIRKLFLPASLSCIEEGAFASCRIKEIYLYDSLEEVSDASFVKVKGLTTLHINAATSPVYSGSYYDTFAEKYDWLLAISKMKKIVLLSGSSGRYGYDSTAIREAYPDYEVANMGVYAYTNMMPQMELILPLMQEGDILISAPEFDAAEEQFCVDNALDHHFWAMMESNYDAAAQLDLRHYRLVFDSLGSYLSVRQGMEGKSYSIHPWNYDDDGTYYGFSTYNIYGDFILPRQGGTEDVCLRHNIADYTTETITPAYIRALNTQYKYFTDKNITVYFTYTPRNHMSLTPESTEEARAALDEELHEQISVPVISHLEDYLYEGMYFWKIDSHTTTAGAKRRTQQLLKDLEEYQ